MMEPIGMYGDGSGSKTGNVIAQDTAKMAAISSELDSYADTFKLEAAKLFENLEAKITATQTENSVWWGPQAQLFITDFSKKQSEFEKAEKNIRAYSTNMSEQAENWVSFETKKDI